MKKICFIDYDMSITGGVEGVTASLVNTLADFYEVHLISICGGSTPAYSLDSRIKFSVLFDTEERLSVMRKNAKPLLVKYFKDNNITVAFAQGNYPGFILSAVRFNTRTKIIFCDHGALMNQWHQKDIVVIRLINSYLHHKTITLTDQSLKAYKKKFLISKNRISSIPNWISDDVAVSEKYNTASKRIISAGRFGKEKGFDMLVKAFAPVVRKHPDWHLDIYGDGEMFDTVKELIENLKIADNVHLMGMCSNLSDKYKDYSMYVLPSYREGLPLVLLEAKANRLPIVSFDILTGPREIMRDGVDGILVPPYDLEKMGAAICRLIEDDSLRISMSEKSQDNVENFSKPTILKQWCDLIESI
ncbi:MAG: glycosyltransferase family 4 protein [Clostridia bacterium]|nr:glycosyltransferase family 4 protein [Clostridia bacterium]